MSCAGCAVSDCVENCSKATKDVGNSAKSKEKICESEVPNRFLVVKLSLKELSMGRLYAEEVLRILRHDVGLLGNGSGHSLMNANP